MRRLVSVMACLVGVWVSAVAGAEPKAEFGFGDDGLKSIRWGGAELLASGKFFLGPVVMIDANGNPSRPEGELITKYDPTNKTLSITAAWGTVACKYAMQADRMNLEIAVANKSAETLAELSLTAMELKLADPNGHEPNFPRLYDDDFGRMYAPRSFHNVGAPTIIPANFGTGQAVLCNDDPNLPLTLSLDGKGGAYRVNLRAGGNRKVFDTVFTTRTIAPGATDTYKISLRIGDAGASPLDLADDVIKAYAKAFGATLKWADRRPIARSFPAGGLPVAELIARTSMPASAPADANTRRRDMLAKAGGVIANCKALNAQGVIIWEIEGTAVPSVTYVGDPRQTAWMNPATDLVADEFFQKIRDAGFRVGVCIRPSRVVWNAQKTKLYHSYQVAGDPFTELDTKIEYSKKRWGCTIFYIDTNGFERATDANSKPTWGLIAPDVWRRLSEKHPDVLLIPELKQPQYYAYTCPYSELDMGARETPEMIRRIWPGAFASIQLEDDDAIEMHDALVKIVQVGDVVMTNGGGPRTSTGVTTAYMEANYIAQGAPAAVKSAGADLARLLAASSDADARTRYFAARALGEAYDANAMLRLQEMLADSDWLVRKAACVGLGAYGDGNRVTSVSLAASINTSLLAKLITDANSHMDWIAARAMARIGPSSVAPLVEIVAGAGRRLGPPVWALGELKAPEAVEPLDKLLANDKGDYDGRMRGVDALVKIGGEAAIGIVIRTLETAKNDNLRQAAAKALGRTKDPRALPALEAALAREKALEKSNNDFVGAINGSIGRLKGK